jgi:hypothetical protein
MRINGTRIERGISIPSQMRAAVTYRADAKRFAAQSPGVARFPQADTAWLLVVSK